MQREHGGVGFLCANQLLPIFSNPGPPTNLLLLVTKEEVQTNIASLVASTVINHATIGTCRLTILQWVQESLGACVHGPPHFSKLLECDWMVACAYLHANTSNPLLARTQWASGLHGSSPQGVNGSILCGLQPLITYPFQWASGVCHLCKKNMLIGCHVLEVVCQGKVMRPQSNTFLMVTPIFDVQTINKCVQRCH